MKGWRLKDRTCETCGRRIGAARRVCPGCGQVEREAKRPGVFNTTEVVHLRPIITNRGRRVGWAVMRESERWVSGTSLARYPFGRHGDAMADVIKHNSALPLAY